MTPEAANYFRDWTRLRYFVDTEDPRQVFEGLAALYAWSLKQRKSRGDDASLDAMITGPLECEPGLFIGLLVYLATVHPQFFALAKRMASRDLLRRPPSEPVRAIAAYLLVAEAPSGTRYALPRRVIAVLAIIVAHSFGMRPTENLKKPNPNSQEGCSGVTAFVNALANLGVSETAAAITKIWMEKKAVLSDAGFPEADIDDLLIRLEILRKDFK